MAGFELFSPPTAFISSLYIDLPMSSTRTEMERLRGATADLIGVYRLCNEHVGKLESYNERCQEGLARAADRIRNMEDDTRRYYI